MALFSRIGALFGGSTGPAQAHGVQPPTEPLPLPTTITVRGVDVTLRLLETSDRDAMLAFSRALPEEDLMFLRRDITRDEEVDAWLRDAEEGFIWAVLAVSEDMIVGYAAVVSDRTSWTRHVSEIRVLIAPSMRGQGVGRLLTAQAFAIAKQRGTRKMIAQMTTDQEPAQRAFERMGFASEAVLRRQVIDRRGNFHDLRIMSIDVEAVQQKLDVAWAQSQIDSLAP